MVLSCLVEVLRIPHISMEDMDIVCCSKLLQVHPLKDNAILRNKPRVAYTVIVTVASAAYNSKNAATCVAGCWV
jgi:hypothetical protein